MASLEKKLKKMDDGLNTLRALIVNKQKEMNECKDIHKKQSLKVQLSEYRELYKTLSDNYTKLLKEKLIHDQHEEY